MVTKAIEASDISVLNCDNMKEEPESLYQKEWDSLFSNKYYLKRLKSLAMKGRLKTHNFRSICWKVFLECLPEDRSLWIETTKYKRQLYVELLDKFAADPHVSSEIDININNPLSQAHQNPWTQYFQDEELRVTIQQDVVRTFPEIEFFHRKDIQKMMISILFSYAREFPHISYKQGMHELLAPIIFVLHNDQQIYLQSCETDTLDLEIRILLNQNYIEHDAFFLFCQLMEAVEPWYTSNDNNKSFEVPGNSLGIKLTRIYEHLLKQNDTDLFIYLEKMEITPQIFGIRWLRLLFGREFSIQDLLTVWDAIFSDSITFNLVDYIFVAMLIYIREQLIQGDYTSCLSHLMRFPNVVDIKHIIDLALHVRNPNDFKKPEGKSVKILNSFISKTNKDGHQTVGKSFSKLSYPGSAKPVNKNPEVHPKSLSIANVNATLSNDGLPSKGARAKSSSLSEKYKHRVSLDSPEFDQSSFGFLDVSMPYGVNQSFTLPRTSIRNVMEGKNHKFRASELSQDAGSSNEKKMASNNMDREMLPLVPSSSASSHHKQFPIKKDHKLPPKDSVEEIKVLESEISDLKSMNKYCTQQITQHLEKLQESMMHQCLHNEDEMFIALAGLKRARDILKGTVSFTEEVLGDDLNPYSVISKHSIHIPSESVMNSKTNESPPEDTCSEKNINTKVSEKFTQQNLGTEEENTELSDNSLSCSVLDSNSSNPEPQDDEQLSSRKKNWNMFSYTFS